MRREHIAECDVFFSHHQLIIGYTGDLATRNVSLQRPHTSVMTSFDIFRARLNIGEWMSLVENDSATIFRECSLQIATLHDMRRVDLRVRGCRLQNATVIHNHKAKFALETFARFNFSFSPPRFSRGTQMRFSRCLFFRGSFVTAKHLPLRRRVQSVSSRLLVGHLLKHLCSTPT